MASGEAALAAGGGAIRGRVEVRRISSVERRPSVSELGAPIRASMPDLQERARAVVYLESAPHGPSGRRTDARATMLQRDQRFVPHVLAITTGTVVDFPNDDVFYHNVFSLSKAARFDLGRYAAGASKSARFNRPGIVRVFCDIHSHMNAFILVFSHPFFAVTDAEGRYRIEDVPHGRYRVIAWNEGVASEPQPVTVADGAVAELDFALQ